MSLFMLNKNDLGDVQDVKRARKHLGIGDLALQDSNNVNITDGTISVSNLQIKRGYDFNFGESNTEGYFFVSDSNGFGFWREFDSISENSKLRLTGFSNDAPFLPEAEIELRYSKRDCNLSDLTNIPEAISNLGLDFLLANDNTDPNVYQELNNAKATNIRTDNIIIDEKIQIKKNIELDFVENNFSTGNFLRIDPNNLNKVEVKAFSSNIADTYDDSAPTMNLFNDRYNYLNDTINANFNILDLKLERITAGSNYLEQENNLSDILDKAAARSNLEINLDISTDENGNNILTIKNVIIDDSFIFKNSNNQDITNYFLKADSNGNASWSHLPISTVDDNNLGTVKISDNFDLNDSTTVATTKATYNAYLQAILQIPDNVSAFTNDSEYLSKINFFSEFVSQDERDTALSNLRIRKSHIIDLTKDISQFSNNVNYLLMESNLGEFADGDLIQVRCNLGLHTVATSGKFEDLSNLPKYLESNNLDLNYLQRKLNLEDIEDKTNARSNLELGDLATINRNNVEITGGVFTNIRKIQTEELIITSNNDDLSNNYNVLSNIMFLKAMNSLGEAKFHALPESSLYQKGIVQLSENSNNATKCNVYTAEYINQITSNVINKVDNLDLTELDFINLSSSLSVGGNIIVGNGNEHLIITSLGDITGVSKIEGETAEFSNIKLNGEDLEKVEKLWITDGNSNGTIIDSGTAVKIKNFLNVGGATNITGDTTVSNLKIKGELFLEGELTSSFPINNLSVATITATDRITTSNLTISSSVSFPNSITTRNIYNNNLLTTNNLSVNNGLSVNGGCKIAGTTNTTQLNANNLSISDTSYLNDVEISNKLSVKKIVTEENGLTISGGLTTIQNGLKIENGLSVNDGLTIRTGLLQVDTSLSINGGLNVLDGVFLQKSLSVDGKSLLKNGLSVKEGLNVKGGINTDSLTTSTINLTGGLSVTSGLTRLQDGLEVTDGNTTIDLDLIVNGITKLNRLSVEESVLLKDDLSVFGDVFIKSTLSVKNNCLIEQNLSVNGNICFNSGLSVKEKLIVTGETNLQKLTVSGSTNLQNGLTISSGLTSLEDGLTVSGSTSLQNGLTVRYSTSLEGLEVSDNTTTNTLSVDGQTKMKSKLTITNAALEISGNNSLDISSGLIIANNISVKGTLNAARIDFSNTIDFSTVNILNKLSVKNCLVCDDLKLSVKELYSSILSVNQLSVNDLYINNLNTNEEKSNVHVLVKFQNHEGGPSFWDTPINIFKNIDYEDIHSNVAVVCDILTVRKNIQFTYLENTDPIHILCDGKLFTSDSNGNAEWVDNTRVTQNDGIMFGDTSHGSTKSSQFNMRFSNDSLVIGSNDGTGTFIPRHIFR